MLWFIKVIVLFLMLLSFSLAQTNISTVITNEQRASLEQLVMMAEESNLDVQKAELSLEVASQKLEPLGRLKEAINISGSTTLSGDYYGQISPSYSISLSLNVLDLFPEDQTKQQMLELNDTRASLRLAVIDKYLNYLTALEQAKTRALELEASELAFRAEQARYEVGEVTLVNQSRAQTSVSQAALALLQANTNIVTTIEALAAEIGIPVEALTQILQSQKLE